MRILAKTQSKMRDAERITCEERIGVAVGSAIRSSSNWSSKLCNGRHPASPLPTIYRARRLRYGFLLLSQLGWSFWQPHGDQVDHDGGTMVFESNRVPLHSFSRL